VRTPEITSNADVTASLTNVARIYNPHPRVVAARYTAVMGSFANGPSSWGKLNTSTDDRHT
jgi:hypothetical protein